MTPGAIGSFVNRHGPAARAGVGCQGGCQYAIARLSQAATYGWLIGQMQSA